MSCSAALAALETGCGTPQPYDELERAVVVDGGSGPGTITGCTICDDPADDGEVPWCHTASCSAGAPPQDTDSTAAGYCPALVGRIARDGLTGCGDVVVTSASAYSYCDGGNRVYTGANLECAYTIHAETSNRGEIKERWYSGGGLAEVGMPTSQAYRVPGATDLWYQFFEYGLVMNDRDGADAFYIGGNDPAGLALKQRFKALLSQDNAVDDGGLYPVADSAALAGGRYVELRGCSRCTSPGAGLFAKIDTAYLVEDDNHARYKDYDAAITNPDYASGNLGWPLSDATVEEGSSRPRQLFEGGMIRGTSNTVVTREPQACIYCDDPNDGRPNAFCGADPTVTEIECNAEPGCEWKDYECLGVGLDWCSRNADTFLCKDHQDSASCASGLDCTWTGTRCVNASGGALSQRMTHNGLGHQHCGDAGYDSDSDTYAMSCTVGAVPYELIWSSETECAYMMDEGPSSRGKLAARYNAAFPARQNATPYALGDIRTNQGNVYMATQAGVSGAVSTIPGGTDAATEETDGGVRWRFLATGTKYSDILGPPTSEAIEIGAATDHWVQYFVRGALVIKSGDSTATMIGDGHDTGIRLKQRWLRDQRDGKVVAMDLFPTRDTSIVASGDLLLPTGTATHPSGYFVNAGGAFFLDNEVYERYEDYDPGVSNPDFDRGYLGDVTADQSSGDSTGTWAFATFENGVITDYYGSTWTIYDAYPPPPDFQADTDGNEKPYCLDAAHVDLAMEMRRIAEGWGDFTGPKTAYTDNRDPIEGGTFTGGYHRSAGAGETVVYNVESIAQMAPVKCAFALADELATKWASFDGTERQTYGYPTSDMLPVTDSTGTRKGTVLSLQNGVLVHKASDASAYVLGAGALHGEIRQGRALKNLYRKRFDSNLVDSEGYYLVADASPGHGNSGWVARFEGTAGDPEGKRFAVKGVGCTAYLEQQCDATAFCVWDNTCVNEAFEVKGEINDQYESWDPLDPSLHYEQGDIGYPRMNQECGDETCTWYYQNFEGNHALRHVPPSGIAYLTSTYIAPCYSVCDGTDSCNHSCWDGFVTLSTCGAYGACVECDPGVCPVDPEGDSAQIISPTCDRDPGPALEIVRCEDYLADEHDDSDMDGIADTFEQALAERFAPVMRMTMWSRSQLYGSSALDADCPDSDPECQIPFTVREFDKAGAGIDCTEDYQCLEIIYILAYNFDNGDSPLDHWLFNWALDTFAKHAGDGESVATLVARKDPRTDGGEKFPETSWEIAGSDPAVWYRVKDFYAAHRCSGAESSRIVARHGEPLVRRRAGMKVHVAENKNASYPTDGACDGGSTLNMDNCPDGSMVTGPLNTNNLVNVGEIFRHRRNDHVINRPGYPPLRAPIAGDLAPTQAGGSSGTFDVWGTENFGHGSVVWYLSEAGPMIPMLAPGNIRWESDSWTCR